MKFTESQWNVACMVLENRGYRYYDQMNDKNDIKSLDEYDKEEYIIWKNINQRIQNSNQGSSQRFTKIQKEYLIDMMDEYKNFNTLSDQNYDKDKYKEAKIIQSIIDGLS